MTDTDPKIHLGYASDSEAELLSGSESETVLDKAAVEQELGETCSHPTNHEPDSAVQIEAFDLREELESGAFDDNLTYTRDANDREDLWLEGVNHTDVQRAHKAQKQRLDRKRIEKPQAEILALLIRHLEPAETPLEALARLKRSRDSCRKEAIYNITEACGALSENSYDMSREEFKRLYQRQTGSDYAEPSQPHTQAKKRKLEDEKEWEFRWEGEDQVNGPYTSYEMAYWKDNYFENSVEVRRIGDVFTHVSKVDFGPV